VSLSTVLLLLLRLLSMLDFEKFLSTGVGSQQVLRDSISQTGVAVNCAAVAAAAFDA